MKIFVASDIHFNHVNILKYCPARGDSVQGMNERIIANWNELVSPEDTVYILGDVAMGLITDAPKLVMRLNGNKILVRGNHDKTIVNVPELNEMFSEVCDYKEITFKSDGVKQLIVMSHFPFAHWNGQHRGAIMLHGHLHGHRCGVEGRIKDVGIDTNDLKPYELELVVKELRKIPYRESHHAD